MEFYRRRKIEANIDMTPMIDTLLQLFLIFLLSASFVASSVRLDLPKAGVQQKTQGKPVIVSLDLENHLFINQEMVSPADLLVKLPPLFRKENKQEVLLRADQSLAYKHVLKAIEALKKAGAENIHLAYDEEKGQ